MSFRALAAISLPLALTLGGVPSQAAEPGFWSAGGSTIRASGADYLLQTSSGERRFSLPAGIEIEDLFALRGATFLSARGAGPDRGDLYLALADELGLHPIASPERSAGGTRENAVPLASTRGELEGVAWLEGPDRQSYGVRYAAWTGMGWSAPNVVAAAAPGSQLALSATGLADGSKLLVWSRFDGHDDEIVALRWVHGGWKEAQPIAADNAVPDITPSVVAVPGGALAAWSRYDGHEYRIVVARFDGQTWSQPAWAGPVGSTEPILTRSDSGMLGASGASGGKRTWLTFANAHPRGWGVLELDPAGRVLRQGSVATDLDSRPALALLTSGELRLRWATAHSDLDLK